MKRTFVTICFLFLLSSVFSQDEDIFDLSGEYSEDEFRRAMHFYHNTEYEMAIVHFIKSLSHDSNNHSARFYLGDSYRKAGYEKSALYSWNTLISMGYENQFLKSKISYLYNKSGRLTEIMIDKDYILREDLKGYLNYKDTPLFLNPSQIAVKPNNHYIIASFTGGMVVELDANLNVVQNYFSKLPELKKPFGVAVSDDDSIFVSDFESDVVYKMNTLGIVEQKIGFKGIGEGGLLGPKYLELDDDKSLYVTDSGNSRINKYNHEGNVLFSFGTSGEGQLIEPGGMFYEDGLIYVADKMRNEVIIFDKNGNYINAFGHGTLEKPYDLTRDNLGRLLILCEKKLWAYEDDKGLWYSIDATGSRLDRGVSIVTDMENNIAITEFNKSRFFILSLERRQYTNLNVNIERVISTKFPNIHLLTRIEKDDFTVPLGITGQNISLFENNKFIPVVGTGYTELKNRTSDIAIIIDNNPDLLKYRNEIVTLINTWMKSIGENTSVSLIAFKDNLPYLAGDFPQTRLELADTVKNMTASRFNDKGDSFKFAIYNMLKRFSKKQVVFITDSSETGNDFERFQIEDSIQLAMNNDISYYIVSFEDKPLSPVYRNMAERTGGDYYRVYQRGDLKDLFTGIEERNGDEYVISYVSNAVSRFGLEPIEVEIEIEYSGMKGKTKSIYYPGR